MISVIGLGLEFISIKALPIELTVISVIGFLEFKYQSSSYRTHCDISNRVRVRVHKYQSSSYRTHCDISDRVRVRVHKYQSSSYKLTVISVI